MLERSDFEREHARLCLAYGKSNTPPPTKDLYYQEIQSTGVNCEQFAQAVGEIVRTARFFPRIAELLAAIRTAMAPVSQAGDVLHGPCGCGVCPGDGKVTIFHPRWLDNVARGVGSERFVHPTCVISCRHGGFGKLCRWLVAGETVLAPCLPAPAGMSFDEMEKYASEWMRSN